MREFFQLKFPVLMLAYCCVVILSFPPTLRATVVPISECSIDSYRRTAPDLIERLHNQGLLLGDPIFIRIFKLEAELEVWLQYGERYSHFQTYSICSFSGELGPKEKEGDLQSPEGYYTVGVSQMNPKSSYHLSFNLGYPNRFDRNHSRTGSALMVHGRCSSAGCYAMSDDRMDEIYNLAEAALMRGQKRFPVHIFPFRMTEDNLSRYSASKWLSFWQNLKEGYDIFESRKIPPHVRVKGNRYIFSAQPNRRVSLKTKQFKIKS